MNTLNRLGKCPNCGVSWDGGDILEVLSKLNAFMNKSYEEVRAIAVDCYGWDEENKKHFSNLVKIENKVHNISAEECPSCRHVWSDNIEYENMYNFISGIPYEQKPLIVGTRGDFNLTKEEADMFYQPQKASEQSLKEDWKDDNDDDWQNLLNKMDDDDPPF